MNGNAGSSSKWDSTVPQDGPPKHHVRWFHGGPPMLLSSAPVVLGATPAWQPLTREESDACEESWQALSPEDKAASAIAQQPIEVDNEDVKVGIPVSRDKLFEVDVKAMKLYPVFWRSTATVSVTRGQWMYDELKPVEFPLAARLEKAYLAVQPWQSSYEAELRAALEIGPDGLEKIKTPLVPSTIELNPTSEPDTYVIFEDAAAARVIKGPIRKSLVSMLSAFTGRNKGQAPHPSQLGGTVYYRGSDEAASRIKANQEKARSRSPSVQPRGRKSTGPDEPSAKRARLASPASPAQPRGRPIAEGRFVPLNGSTELLPGVLPAGPVKVDDPSPVQAPENVDEMRSVTDLILVIHGIGQGLTATYEAFDFVYATNMLREVARTQAQSPAISSIMRDRRVQFLPVQWRASLKLDLGEELQKKREGLDNHFSLEDITLKNTIPFVRDLTNKVLLDIPLFMSHHRERMIESVCTLANRTYRLWCARNPGFEKDGRVHIVAHSLGSALVAHILSKQPTVVPPIHHMSNEAKDTRDQFIFNTSNLFMVGSPLGVFIHINQAQLIARKGRSRTMHSPSDEALDRVGIFGCMAVDAVYNIFNPADPVVYLLNPCVDAERAKSLPATAIPNVTEGYMSNFSNALSKVFNNISLPMPWGGATPPTPSKASGPKVDNSGDVDMGMELTMEGEPEALKGSVAERRFAALNPHGTLDYYLPSGTGNISEYVDMITAHSAYWSDESLAAFVLAETFATSADYLRTDVGVPSVNVPGGV